MASHARSVRQFEKNEAADSYNLEWKNQLVH